MEIVKFLKNKSWILVLVLIFLFSYYIRAMNVVPDRLLSFDPIYQYRFTKYFADNGTIPAWDELSYYAGRESKPLPLMYYTTAVVFWIINALGINMSLLTTSAYMSAVYGAMIIIPTFLLVKELTNSYGGSLAAILVGTAPQVLIRTFGSSYDSDQIVLFFIVTTIYLGFMALRKKKVSNYALAVMGFVGFMLSWVFFLYSFAILSIFTVLYMGTSFVADRKTTIFDFKSQIIILSTMFVLLMLIGYLYDVSVITSLGKLIGFAGEPEKSIVNISIAELQPFNILNFDGWLLAMGRFIPGGILTNIIFAVFISFMLFGFLYFAKFKRNIEAFTFLITIFFVSLYTTIRGIRFTEFTSVLFLILIGAGFGCLVNYVKDKKLLKSFVIGLTIFVIILAADIGLGVGRGLGPDINANWEDMWRFFRDETPETSIVGTWWDPGHMIAGLANRRNFADGAHCPSERCLFPINTRITDLGKIMATNDENESVNLIRKYQGASEKAYWIASDDLIGKFQWCQYFGTGCDARVDASCPLYMQLGLESSSADQSGNIVLRKYGTVYVYEGGGAPIPIFVQGINAALFDEIIFYIDGVPQAFPIDEQQRNELVSLLQPLENELNFRFVEQTIDLTVWVPEHRSYIVMIPEHQRNNVFTKMFFLEGQGLENFKQVYKNQQTKVYEVI